MNNTYAAYDATSPDAIAALAREMLFYFGPHGERWTQGAPFRDDSFQELDWNPACPKVPAACCLIGAVSYLRRGTWMLDVNGLRQSLRDYRYDPEIGLADFNDSSSWPQVRDFLEWCVKRGEGQ